MNHMMKWVIIKETIAQVFALYKIRVTGGVMYPFAVSMIMDNDIRIMVINVAIIMTLVTIMWNRKTFATPCKPYKVLVISQNRQFYANQIGKFIKTHSYCISRIMWWIIICLCLIGLPLLVLAFCFCCSCCSLYKHGAGRSKLF